MTKPLTVFFCLACVVTLLVAAAGCEQVTGSQKGTVQFTSSPSGSEIYFDGQYKGTTPSTLADVAFGSHTLEYRHDGYQTWHGTVTVSAASSVFSAALTPAAVTATPTPIQVAIVSTPSSTTYVTITAAREKITIGDSLAFSGTSSGTTIVMLVLTGPGVYTNGKTIARVNVKPDGSWNYTWNPGTSILAGNYKMIAYDAWQTTSDDAAFTAVGGGQVSVSVYPIDAHQAQTVSMSGQCTTGSRGISVTLYGTGQYQSGVNIGTVSCNGDNTWTYKYTVPVNVPLGTYTVTVNDLEMTSSGSAPLYIVG